MKFPCFATLQNIGEVNPRDFGFDDCSFDYEILFRAEGETVTVLREATDGYYDIELSCGTKYHAISRYHLVNFHN